MSEELYEEDEPPMSRPRRAETPRLLETNPRVEELEIELPHSNSGEDGVLSAFLQSPSLLAHFRANYSDEYFHNVCNRGFYKELDKMDRDGKTIDVVTVSQWLIDRQMLDKTGGPSRLAELLNFVPTPAHYPYHVGILEEKLKLRQVLAKTDIIREAVRQEGADMQEFCRVVVGECSQIQAVLESKETEDPMEAAFSRWEERWNDKASGKLESAMPSRWVCLNNTIGGIRPGYTIVSGEYSSGKSVFVANVLVDACINQGRPGILFSYETPVEDVISRMVCDIGGVHGNSVFLPDRFPPTKEVGRAIAHAVMKIRMSKLQIIHKPYMSADEICFIARKKKAKTGDLVVGVDYLQKLPVPKHIEKGANQERELATNSDTLQKLSKELEIPMMVLCQNNKDGSSRGSAAIEMDCDECFRIEGDRGIWVRKNRNGAREFHMPLFLEKGFFRFQQQEEIFPS